jgi:hypothetical protein
MTRARDGTPAAIERRGIARVAGLVLLALTIALAVVGTVLVFAGGDFGRVLWGLPGGSGLWALGFSVAGYPITRRHPANPVGWLLMVAGAAAGVNTLGLGLAADPNDLALWLVNTWVVSVVALSTAVVLFPSGSPPSRWWWAQLGVLWGIGFLEYFKEYDTSDGFVGLPAWLDALAMPVNVLFQLSLAAGFFPLLVRWRRSGPVERQQLKWVVYSVALLATTALVVEVGLVSLAPAFYFAGTVVLYGAILAVPVAIGVAMLRYRLYDIDVVINRTLVYGSLTASLVLLYVGGVVGLQYVFRVFAGGGSQLAVVASTLLIAALFNPLRRRIQNLIDRRFYRKKYDARNTLSDFSNKLRDETDLDVLGEDLVSVVRNTVQPKHVSLWLRETERGE